MFPVIAMAALKGMAIGAGIGAGSAALMGGDVKKGAMLGAAGGGLTGGLAPLGQMAQFAGTPLGEAGAMATQFNRGLASAVGMGSAPAGKAGSLGSQVGQGLTSSAAQGLASAVSRPKPPQVQTVTDFGGGMPPRMGAQPLAQHQPLTLAGGSIYETFQRGLGQ